MSPKTPQNITGWKYIPSRKDTPEAFRKRMMRRRQEAAKAMTAAPAQQVEAKPFQFCDCDDCEDKARIEPPLTNIGMPQFFEESK